MKTLLLLVATLVLLLCRYDKLSNLTFKVRIFATFPLVQMQEMIFDGRRRAIPRWRQPPGDRCTMQPLSMRHALRWSRRCAAWDCLSAPGREDEPAGTGRASASRKRMPTTRCVWERSQASSWGG